MAVWSNNNVSDNKSHGFVDFPLVALSWVIINGPCRAQLHTLRTRDCKPHSHKEIVASPIFILALLAMR